MKLEYLPNENDDSYIMYAFLDDRKNEVIWNGVTNSSSYMDHVMGTEMAQFTVCRRGKVVIVEACGWYSSGFHYRMELTAEPDHVVILAAEAANLHDRARDE